MLLVFFDKRFAMSVLQVCSMNDKQSFHSDWLSDVLKSELLISDEDFLADLDKSDHSFLKHLLSDRAASDKCELDSQRSDNDVFDSTVVSASQSHFVDTVSKSEHSDEQILCTETKAVAKPPGSVEKGSKRGRLRCQISRTNSAADRSFVDDSTENLLKTPAGFYDRSSLASCLSIPPLFDYSSGLFTNPCHFSDASGSISSADTSPLCSIMEDEKWWSEGSDIDASSLSALSPSDVAEDGKLSEDEDVLSKQEERVVLSVVQNVLSDEAVTLSSDDTKKDESHCDEDRLSPEIPSPESSPAAVETCHSNQSSTSDMSKLNPLARPFRCVPKLHKMPIQPVPVILTPSMPTVVVPVKFAYTKLVPVATTKSSSPKQPEKSNIYQNSTLMLPSNTPNSK